MLLAMLHKLFLLYAWLVRTLLFFLPDFPLFMRFRGWLYGLGMKQCGKNLQIAHSAIINGVDLCHFGRNIYIANACNIILNGELSIGDEVIFGPGVLVSAGNLNLQKKMLRLETVVGLEEIVQFFVAL